jgi:16S rRNA (cytosine967-C5)-methyltransferase
MDRPTDTPVKTPVNRPMKVANERLDKGPKEGPNKVPNKVPNKEASLGPSSTPTERPVSPSEGGWNADPPHSAPGGSGAPPLWQQLLGAAEALGAVRAGVSGTAALARVAPVLRPGVQALVFQALRNLALAEHVRRQLAPRKPPPAVDALLCLALALAGKADALPYAPHTLVSQCVEAAKRSPVMRGQASFVNACLRRFLREQDALVATAQRDPVVQWNHPAWWVTRLREDHPRAWQQILQASQRQAPLHLRVNVRRCTPQDYLRQLHAAGLEASAGQGAAIVLAQAVPVERLPGFADGLVSVQDAAAQCAAPLLLRDLPAWHGDRPALRVLDACAAPGGKSAHLLELAAMDLTALELDATRSPRIGQSLQRLGLQARVVVGDAAQPADWWDGQPFDAILLDAPCTASGIVRRHPDIPWLRQPGDVARLAALQARILKSLWPLLRPGGRLLYCTCSVFRAEGDAQIQTFVAHNTDARMLPSPGHLIPRTGMADEVVPDNLPGDHDGFFYALLHKEAA